MQLYAVKLLPGHKATPDLCGEGYLSLYGEKLIYDLKWAKKKAEVFGGKIEKIGKNYKTSSTQIRLFAFDEMFMDTIKLLDLKRNKILEAEAFRTRVTKALKYAKIDEEVKLELNSFGDMISGFEYLKFE